MPTEQEILDALEKGIFLEPKEPKSKEEDSFNGDSKKNSREHENVENLDDNNSHDIIFLKKYQDIFKKRTYNDFHNHFLIRYRNIEGILKSRQELKGLISIARLESKSDKDKVSVIGMISEISETKNGHIIMKVEDPTGNIPVLVSINNSKLHKFAKDLVLDEIVGINGSYGKDIIFANSIIFPDVPLTHELKKHPDEIYAAFIGDPHLGSNVFLEKDFLKMISWINGEIGTEKHKEIAKKIKYVFIVGDLVEGVGIYPGQDIDLKEEFHNIKNQYDKIVSMFKKIRKDITLIICPGNHDYGRIAEPQLPLTSEYSKSLQKMNNVVLVSNPAFLNFGKTEDFPGFNILMYHGGSLIYYSENVPKIRTAGGQRAVHLTMQFLLQRRHLAPTHGSTLYIPDPEKDFLFIDNIPDFFVTGHIHRANIGSYRNITLISSSCWTGKTEDQVKRGLEPQPARLPLINLHTREVKIINFLSKENKGVMNK